MRSTVTIFRGIGSMTELTVLRSKTREGSMNELELRPACERSVMTQPDTTTTNTPPRATTAPPAESPPHSRATLALTSVATAVALMTYTAPMVTLPDTAAALHTPLSAQAWLLNGTPLG